MISVRNSMSANTLARLSGRGNGGSARAQAQSQGAHAG
jgi:hypothetical protein